MPFFFLRDSWELQEAAAGQYGALSEWQEKMASLNKNLT
jgi:hypothetical protein